MTIPLPEPSRKVHMGGGKFQLFFSAEQMHAYAAAAVAAERADADTLHVAVCQAVALLNRAPEVARCTEGREAHNLLRQALVDYADAAIRGSAA